MSSVRVRREGSVVLFYEVRVFFFFSGRGEVNGLSNF